MDNLEAVVPKTAQGLVRHRYVLCMLVFVGLGLVYSMRVNMSVTIIKMVGSKGKNISGADDGTCPAPNNETIPPEKGEFNWDSFQQGVVLNSFFVGYITTQIIGGIMADKLSIKWVFGYGIFLTSVLTVITQWVARWSIYGLILLRALEGVTEGVTFPSLFCLIARWAPVSERTTMVNLCITGASVGTVITLPLAAALCESSWGWEAAFYIPGALGILWSLLWYICATSQPENHPWISDEERQYIINNRGTTHSSSRKIPWGTIVTSRPVLLFAMARFCAGITFYVFLTEMPTFIDNIFHISMKNNGFLNGFFYICYAMVAFISGYVSDRLIHSKRLSRTTVRKIFECSSFCISGSMLLLVTVIGCNWTFVAVILCLSSVSLALNGGGDAAMALDLAPDLAGSVMGFGNMVGNSAGIVAPLLVSAITKNNATFYGWNNVFYVTASVSLIGALIFGLFATAEEQPWSKEEDDEVQIIGDD